MRILVITHQLLGDDEPGANRIWDTVQYFREQGHSVEVIGSTIRYFDESESQPERKGIIQSETCDEIAIIRIRGLQGYKKSLVTRMIHYLNFALMSAIVGVRRDRPDLVITFIQPIFAGVAGWIVARLQRAPFVLEVRDLWPESAVQLGILRSRVIIKMGRMLEDWLYNVADHIIAFTPGIKRQLVRQGVPDKDLTVIPNGVAKAVTEHSGESIDLVEKIGVPEGAFVVMYTGAFGLYNELDTLLRAAHELRDLDDTYFVMVGGGVERQKIISLADRMSLSNVRFVDPQPKGMIPAWLGTADVCTLALPEGEFWEIFLQNKLFDYLGCGRPVVAAVRGDQKNVIEDAEAGIVVQPGNVEGLAAGIRKLYSDRELRRRLGRNAERYANRELVRQGLLSRYKDIFRSLGVGEASGGER